MSKETKETFGIITYYGGYKMIYGYCRVSTTHQRITRQVNNILSMEPKAIIIKEFLKIRGSANEQYCNLFIKTNA